MSTHRTFLAKMPTVAGTMPYLDILIEGPVGTAALPVKVAAGGTTPPSGWQGGADFVNAPGGVGDGQFYELRGRTKRIEQPFGATNNDISSFVPLTRLGWEVSLVCSDNTDDGCAPPCCVLYSASLIGRPASPFDVMGIAIPNVDPSYGPVLRLLNTPDVQGRVFTLCWSVNDANDEGRSPTAGSV
jgi:hypothetical protein